jgi:hypothetical protein
LKTATLEANAFLDEVEDCCGPFLKEIVDTCFTNPPARQDGRGPAYSIIEEVASALREDLSGLKGTISNWIASRVVCEKQRVQVVTYP